MWILEYFFMVTSQFPKGTSKSNDVMCFLYVRGSGPRATFLPLKSRKQDSTVTSWDTCIIYLSSSTVPIPLRLESDAITVVIQTVQPNWVIGLGLCEWTETHDGLLRLEWKDVAVHRPAHSVLSAGTWLTIWWANHVVSNCCVQWTTTRQSKNSCHIWRYLNRKNLKRIHIRCDCSWKEKILKRNRIKLESSWE